MESTESTRPTAHAVKSWPGAFTAFGMAFEGVKKNPQPAYLFLAIYAACAVLDVAIGKGPMTTISNAGVQSHNTQLFTLLAYFILLLAIPSYTLAIANEKPVSIATLFAANVGKYFAVLGTTILLLLIFIAGIIPLAIPLIWFVPWFSMAVLFVVDKDARPVEALQQSKQLTRHHKGKVWGLVGANIVVALLPAFVLPLIPVVGSVLIAIVSGFIGLLFSCALAILYRWLQQQPSAQ
jgi:hypothetical protein